MVELGLRSRPMTAFGASESLMTRQPRAVASSATTSPGRRRPSLSQRQRRPSFTSRPSQALRPSAGGFAAPEPSGGRYLVGERQSMAGCRQSTARQSTAERHSRADRASYMTRKGSLDSSKACRTSFQVSNIA